MAYYAVPLFSHLVVFHYIRQYIFIRKLFINKINSQKNE